MFKNWQQWQNSLDTVGTPKADAKTMSPTLRSDIYTALDQAKPWLMGTTPRQAGDGVSYQPILAIIHHHFPDLKLGIESIGNTEAEVALIVAGITNMVLEMSKWDAMAGAMSMRTWVTVLGDAHARTDPNTKRKAQVGRGITRGINQLSDVSLMTKDFTARIQIISVLKSVNAKVYGAGTEEARQGEALWSSRCI